MNRLEIVTAAFHRYEGELRAYSDQAMGVGVGYEDAQTVTQTEGERYAIVVLLPEVMPESEQQRFPEKIRFRAAELDGLHALGDEEVEVKVRTERKTIHLLGVVKENAQPPADMAIMSGTHTGGDPIYNSSGTWIGTGGCVMKINGQHCIVSNEHVLKRAGMNGAVCNRSSQMATVNWLNAPTDSGSAVLSGGTAYNNNIPGIGTPSKIVGGINVGWYGKKRGAATNVTDFHIRWWGNLNGYWTAIGVNMGGFNVVVNGHGDSGAVVIGNNNELIGLSYAGATDVGPGPGGRLFSEIFIIDITVAFPKGQLA